MNKRDEIREIMQALIISKQYHYPDELVNNAVKIWENFDKFLERNETRIFDSELRSRQEMYHLDQPITKNDTLDGFMLRK